MENEKNLDEPDTDETKIRRIVKDEIDKSNRALLDEFDTRLGKYKLPKGYMTCAECGTIHPEIFSCPNPKCSMHTTKELNDEAEKKQEAKPEAEQDPTDRYY